MEIGDYVRTKSGFIDKIININEFREPNMIYALEQPSWSDDIVFVGEEEIIKSRPNTIDLIEVGDYVNGYRVVNIEYLQDKVAEIHLDTYDLFEQDIYREEDIKSIVTKEQFESMEYKVGEDKE